MAEIAPNIPTQEETRAAIQLIVGLSRFALISHYEMIVPWNWAMETLGDAGLGLSLAETEAASKVTQEKFGTPGILAHDILIEKLTGNQAQIMNLLSAYTTEMAGIRREDANGN